VGAAGGRRPPAAAGGAGWLLCKKQARNQSLEILRPSAGARPELRMIGGSFFSDRSHQVENF